MAPKDRAAPLGQGLGWHWLSAPRAGETAGEGAHWPGSANRSHVHRLRSGLQAALNAADDHPAATGRGAASGTGHGRGERGEQHAGGQKPGPRDPLRIKRPKEIRRETRGCQGVGAGRPQVQGSFRGVASVLSRLRPMSELFATGLRPQHGCLKTAAAEKSRGWRAGWELSPRPTSAPPRPSRCAAGWTGRPAAPSRGRGAVWPGQSS